MKIKKIEIPVNLDGVVQVRMKKTDLVKLKRKAAAKGLRLSQIARLLLLEWCENR